jgi:hypothetical protein
MQTAGRSAGSTRGTQVTAIVTGQIMTDASLLKNSKVPARGDGAGGLTAALASVPFPRDAARAGNRESLAGERDRSGPGWCAFGFIFFGIYVAVCFRNSSTHIVDICIMI